MKSERYGFFLMEQSGFIDKNECIMACTKRMMDGLLSGEERICCLCWLAYCDIHHRLYQYCGIPVSMSPQCQQVKKNTSLLHTHVLTVT